MTKFSLLPYSQIQHNRKSYELIEKCDIDFEVIRDQRDFMFFENAKKAIHYVMEELSLTREDEVYISTSSDSNFVSTCVSATIFNYSRLSRILTDNTKLIFIIHEFGFYNQETDRLIEEGEKRGIPVVEDCAHTLSTFHNEIRAGSRGNYSLYSLPKIFPVNQGGLLLGNKLNRSNVNYSELINSEIYNIFNENLPLLKSLDNRRKLLFNYYDKKLQYPKKIFELNSSIPFIYCFRSNIYQKIYKELDNSRIELARTYNKDWVALPVNPFFYCKDIDAIVDIVAKYIDL